MSTVTVTQSGEKKTIQTANLAMSRNRGYIVGVRDQRGRVSITSQVKTNSL